MALADDLAPIIAAATPAAVAAVAGGITTAPALGTSFGLAPAGIYSGEQRSDRFDQIKKNLKPPPPYHISSHKGSGCSSSGSVAAIGSLQQASARTSGRI